MIPMSSRVVLMSALVVVGGCSRNEPAPPPVDPTPAVVIEPVSVVYACESGKTVAVQYLAADAATGAEANSVPGVGSARVSYLNENHVLPSAEAASGARYSGDGFEWWVTNRQGKETATLGRLGARGAVVAIAERCERLSDKAATPAGLPASAPGGVLAAAAPCTTEGLALSAEGGDAGMGNRVAVLGLRNTGPQACSLSGYPGVTLLDKDGAAVSQVRIDQTTGNYFRSGQAPTPVELASGAKAYFDLAWNVVPNEGNGEKTCPGVEAVRIKTPVVAGAAAAGAAAGGDKPTAGLTLAQGMRPCGGRVRLTPLRPVLEDISTPAAAPAKKG